MSECGESTANGCYYQEQSDPPRFMQTNRRHEIVQQTQMTNQEYGGSYSQTVWVLQRIHPDDARCALYATNCLNHCTNGVRFGTELQWKSISGCLPLPRVRNGMVRKTCKGRDVTRWAVHRTKSRKRSLGMLFDEPQSPPWQPFRRYPSCNPSNYGFKGMAHQPPSKRMKIL